MPEQLTAHKLCYRQNGRMLIDSLSLTLAPGEMVALIGPNGAGKSTLLRMLSGWITPDSGECRLEGKPLENWSQTALSRKRAMMRQQNPMAFSWPAQAVVEMGRAPWPENATPMLTGEIMALTGCSELASRDYRTLSGGEQQRIQLARALAQLWHNDGPCGWLFLDEPTSALDLHHQQQVLRLLKTLVVPGKLHICVVLHDLNLAALWADRIMLMHSGRLVADGAPSDVIEEQTLRHWYQADVAVYPHPERAVPQVFLRQ